MKTKALLLVMTPVLLSGCAGQKEKLYFAESHEFGFTAKANPTGSTDFVIGYKQTDLAVIPVAVLESDGNIEQRRSTNKEGKYRDRRDTLSVFGQFSADSTATTDDGGKTKKEVKFGRFFASGLAAENLAKGFSEGWHLASDAGTGKTASDSAQVAKTAAQDAKKAAQDAKKAADEADNSAKNAKTALGEMVGDVVAKQLAENKVPEPNSPDIPKKIRTKPTDGVTARVLDPLIFGQYDSLGIELSADLSNLSNPVGGNFVLGYSGRNFAIIPVLAERNDGTYAKLGSKNENNLSDGKNEDKDAYSVVGQFKANADRNAPNLHLDRFFATGMAATYLSEGLQQKISDEVKVRDKQ